MIYIIFLFFFAISTYMTVLINLSGGLNNIFMKWESLSSPFAS